MALQELCIAHNDLRRQIAQLEKAERELAEQIIKLSGHDKIGQATYDLDDGKLTITTKENHTLDKARLNVDWSDELPINRSYSYTLREKDYKAMIEHGTSDQRKLLSEIVTTKPAKPVVKYEVA